MHSDDTQLEAQVLKALRGSWNSYVLLRVEDRTMILQPVIGGGSLLLHIDDSKLADACCRFLIARGAPVFTDFAELDRQFGVSKPIKPIPIENDLA